MATLEIIGAPQSNFVRTARMACMEKGVPYTLTSARPHSPDVDAIHPFGKIPVMRHGDFSLCETKAICSYIDLAFDGPPLIPRDPTGAARTEQWISLVNTGFDLVVRTPVSRGVFLLRPSRRRSRSHEDRRRTAEDARDVRGAGS